MRVPSWTGAVRNGPTHRNPTPNQNPRAVTLGVKKVSAPHWVWRGGDKQSEVHTFTLPQGSFELSRFDLDADRLAFAFTRPNQGDEYKCDLKRRADGKFAGTCDFSGNPQTIELTPPTVEPAQK